MRLESTSADRFNTVLMAQFRPDIHKLGAFFIEILLFIFCCCCWYVQTWIRNGCQYVSLSGWQWRRLEWRNSCAIATQPTQNLTSITPRKRRTSSSTMKTRRPSSLPASSNQVECLTRSPANWLTKQWFAYQSESNCLLWKRIHSLSLYLSYSTIFSDYAGCKPVMFWMAVRHGTQYPPSVDVNRMKDRLPKLRRTILQNHKERRGRPRNIYRSPFQKKKIFKFFNWIGIGTLCQQDIDGLSNDGSIRIDDNVDETLTSSGREELLVLARRFRGRFAEFFNAQPAFTAQDYQVNKYTYRISKNKTGSQCQPDSNGEWQFRHIAGSSASQSSARSFSRGIFTNGDVQLTEAPVGDRLVHFFENCTRWREQLEETGLLEQEIDLYRQGATFQSTLADVTTRLGFQYNMSAGKQISKKKGNQFHFTFNDLVISEDMLLIYDMCRYQKAWYLEQISPWCAAFTSENLKVKSTVSSENKWWVRECWH